MSFHAHAAHAKKSALEPFVYEPAPLGPQDVEIRISHCGICHSDVHLVDGDWGMGSYPMVPGPRDRGHGHGPRAGGPAPGGGRSGSASAGSAAPASSASACIAGDENLCAQSVATCVDHYGGFADRDPPRRPLRLPDPRGPRLRERGPAPLRRGHRLLAAPALGDAVDAGRRGGDRRPRAPRPPVRPRHGLRGDGDLLDSRQGGRGPFASGPTTSWRPARRRPSLRRSRASTSSSPRSS